MTPERLAQLAYNKTLPLKTLHIRLEECVREIDRLRRLARDAFLEGFGSGMGWERNREFQPSRTARGAAAAEAWDKSTVRKELDE